MTRTALGLLATAFSPLVFSGSTIAPPAGFTARSALPQAAAAGKKWRSDAALTHVSSLTVQADGTAKSWIYTFYALASKKTLNVTVAPGVPLDILEVPNTSIVPIGDVWVDSDRALQEAKKHDLKGKSLSMGLAVMGATGSAVWAVNGGMDEGDVSVILVGKTGAFIRRQVITYK
jgi:hypothetical protein